MSQKYERLEHVFEPVFDDRSQILILGTFPSVKSRENQFYYGHPQNRFWKVLAAICETRLPATIEEKKQFLIKNHIAIWDVIAKCDIIGSSDSSIRNVEANDLQLILQHASIRKIFANGGKAYELYQKYTLKTTQREIIRLPSTSPANAAFSVEKLVEKWSVIKDFIEIPQGI